MKIKQIIFAIWLVLGGQACIGQALAPQVVSSSGGSYGNSNATLNWSLGESITSTDNGGNGYLTQGFHQPSSIVITAISNIQNPRSSDVTIYPNPASSSIYVQWSGDKQLQIQLMDMNGKLIESKMLTGSGSQLNMNSLANGVYLLKVYDMNNHFIQSAKLEKVK